MLTPIEITTMKARKNAAKGALRFFKHIVPVKSTNNLSCYNGSVGVRVNLLRCFGTQQHIINAYRKENDLSVMNALTNVVRTGVGNCFEKSCICYAGLAGNPAIMHNSVVTLCEVRNYDHVIVIVSDGALYGRSNVSIRNLSKTVMVVDGWTEDWYFPNLDTHSAYLNHLINIPNPRQFYVRYGVMHNMIREEPANNFYHYKVLRPVIR